LTDFQPKTRQASKKINSPKNVTPYKAAIFNAVKSTSVKNFTYRYVNFIQYAMAGGTLGCFSKFKTPGALYDGRLWRHPDGAPSKLSKFNISLYRR